MSDTRSISGEVAAAIEGNVSLVQQRLLADEGIAPEDWAPAVSFLSGIVERQRERLDPAARQRLSQVIGSYLGAAAINLHSGRWVETEDGIGVEFAESVIGFPFAKVAKQFENGIEDNIEGFLNTIPYLIEKKRKDTK